MARSEEGREPATGLEGSAFETLVGEHTDSLYRFARSLVRDSAAAEDLVQETFLRAFEKRHTFRGDASPATWLHRILHNLAIDRSRRLGPELLTAEVEERWRDDAYTVDSETVIERAQTREELEDALIRLPFLYRAAVVLHDIEDWTARRIAETLGIGLPAAKQRIRRGRMMLVTALAQGAERRAAHSGVPMRCWDARRRVSDYIDGELSAEERTRLERHLEICPTCPPLYASLVGVREKLGGLRDPDTVVPLTLAEQIRTAVGRRGRR